jgi:hypothetical protein
MVISQEAKSTPVLCPLMDPFFPLKTKYSEMGLLVRVGIWHGNVLMVCAVIREGIK